MADLTLNLILYRLNETVTNMADAILGFFYVNETRETLDVVNMLFVGWILLGVLVYLFGSFIASIHGDRAAEPADDGQSKSDELSKSGELNNADGQIGKQKSTGAAGSARSSATGSPVSEQAVVTYSVADLQGAPRTGALEKVPVAVGSDAGSVRWINAILIWFHTTTKHSLLSECWIHAINEKTTKISPENEVLVEFEKLSEGCPQPEIRDVQVSTETSNNVTVNCKVVAKQLAFILLASRKSGKEKASAASEYQLILDHLDGKLKVTCNTEDKLLVVKFVDKPDVNLSLKLLKSGVLKESALDQRAFEDAITDIALQALANAVVDLHLSQDPDFPNYVKDKGSISPSSVSSAVDAPEPTVVKHEQRLFVKVIKASNLGGDKGCQEGYCVVEMDDPPQKFQTSTIKATNSPFWDEHFLFNVKNSSAEVLFEIYDKGKSTGEKFLGLGIVSVEELLKNPSQRQIITLQSRPLENDKVTGSLTAEFLFMEGSEIPVRQQAGRTVETNSRVTPGGKIITTTTIKKSGEEDAIDQDSVPLTDTALKEIEQMGKTGMSTNKSTLIIHSVQREVVRPTLKVKLDKDGRWHEVPAPQANGDHSGSGSPSSPTTKNVPSPAASASSSDKDDRSGRTKERKSFMGTLRKRLSFKKNRSKSVDPNGVDGQPSPNSRSASADRSKSVPGSREQSAGRQPSNLAVPGGGSTRSSISEGSGFSGASSRTYINENSTLVIEINENGITKHYLIPFSLATRSKWRKRGVKLHIYNDHTFVAKHISGSVICQVCTRHFPRRPGKQAYTCRDCDLQCHKTCHVKVEARCPNSTIHSLEMEYVQDPRLKSTTS